MTLKLTEIVKPSDISAFVQLQASCLSEDIQKMQFLARLQHRQAHCTAQPDVELLVLYEISRNPALDIAFLVTDHHEQALALFAETLSGKDIAQRLNVAWVQLKQGLSLAPVYIPKPWGQEIWYTGIEQRGVSQVQSAEGCTPLDWVIAAAPEQLMANAGEVPVLLKVLDPLPDEVYGDLYFEMHEAKQEVYVVTHVDRAAWPDGRGGIRFGFDQQVRKQYADDQRFKQAYLQAVIRYRAVREQIDQQLDACRHEEGMQQNDPVAPERIKQWLTGVPAELQASEVKLRQQMENFIAMRPLQVGDVVKVPCYTPHSLQHGVRTVEFQTPVYERKILSFAQKVLTQNHWDTESAMDMLSLEAPDDQSLTVLEQNKHRLRERVVSFDHFQVERIAMAAGSSFQRSSGSYALLMLLEGSLQWKDRQLASGDVVFVPAVTELSLKNLSDKSVLLLAEPA